MKRSQEREVRLRKTAETVQRLTAIVHRVERTDSIFKSICPGSTTIWRRLLAFIILKSKGENFRYYLATHTHILSWLICRKLCDRQTFFCREKVNCDILSKTRLFVKSSTFDTFGVIQTNLELVGNQMSSVHRECRQRGDS